ncbi:MAG: wax ester/triacylglycerol synthase domain-containing protein [Candidatus Binatia bacterium]
MRRSEGPMVYSRRYQGHDRGGRASVKGVRQPQVDSRLSGEDLTFWWLDSPMQPTTMAMLLMLDSPPEASRLRLAFERAVTAVPRLAQRVVDAPLDLTLPRWKFDPTFDLDYHVRRHPLCGRADMDELLREVGPFYESAFDRSRPLWEARLYDGLGPERRSALFFKLHHTVADGVGGNAILAALTDAEREAAEPVSRSTPQVPGAWAPQRPLGARLLDAIRDRVELDVERAGAAAGAVVDAIEHPEKVARLLAALRSIIQLARFESYSPLKNSAGRARRLSGLDLPFAEVRGLKHRLGGSMIDVILTIMARAIGKWYAAHRISKVRELMTLVPVNLRKPEEWAAKPHVGNVATGILVPLPIRLADPLATYQEIHKRMEAKKADPLSTASPMLADLLSLLPHALVTWMAETSFGRVDLIITNVPGILVPRYLAGAEIKAAYPFAPVAMKSPVSVALYGYRDRLFVGLNSDDKLMPDIDAFKGMIQEAFEHLRAAIGRR